MSSSWTKSKFSFYLLDQAEVHSTLRKAAWLSWAKGRIINFFAFEPTEAIEELWSYMYSYSLLLVVERKY